MKSKYTDFLPSEPVEVKWHAAAYIRLSKEDGDKAESDSVASQREIIKAYVKDHPDMEIVDFYIDDGWSGTNFVRASFERMIEDIRCGIINCVIVKDLSRFGRNASLAGQYIDDFFPRHGVRFIAINNNHDSMSQNGNAMTNCIMLGVTNVINESISATTSVNIRGTLNLNRQQGLFIGSHASYGYLKDPNDHHKLIIDEGAAPIVRRIFEEYLGGKAIIAIAKSLNGNGIPCPSVYKALQGQKYRQPSNPDGKALWSDRSIRRILENQMYCGDMVQGKREKISYKIKQIKDMPKEDWIIVENTHEPIISREDFAKVQALLNSGIRRSPKTKQVDLFSGLVRCADCGRGMNKKTNTHDYGTYHYYRCATRRKMSTTACTNHTIRIDKLETAVLKTIQNLIAVAIEFDEVLAQLRQNDQRRTQSSHLESALRTRRQAREKTMRLMTELYPDWKNGDITKEEYTRLKAELSVRLEEHDKHISSLEKSIADFLCGFSEENDFVAHFKRRGNVDRLTRPLLTELVDVIYVHEGGDIEIVFKFKDAYKEALEYIELNKDIIHPKKTA